MNDIAVWAVIVGMAALNFGIRFLPVAVISRVELPRPVMRWLQYVPVSVMGALVANAVVRPGGDFIEPWANPWLLATAVTAFAYHFTRSFLGATVTGMASFVLIRALLGG